MNETFTEYKVKRRLARFIRLLLEKEIDATSLLDVLVESFNLGFNENGEIVISDIEYD